MKYKILLSFLILTNLAFAVSAQQSKLTISSEAEMKADMELGPCKGRKERREAVKKLFLKMGAAESDIVFDKIDDVENVVVTKKVKPTKRSSSGRTSIRPKPAAERSIIGQVL